MVQTAERLVSTDAERYLLLYMVLVMVLVTAFVILFFIVFQKRKNKMLLDKYEQERKFEKELIKIQEEIQEETLKNVGRELHDNVGQLLSFASMQLNLVSKLTSDKVKTKVDDTLSIVKDAIQEVRGLSKSLNNEVISSMGLRESINNEIERLNKLDTITAKLKVTGKEKRIQPNDSIILFRIVQEFMSNAIKYSEASMIKVELNYTTSYLELRAQDNGVGFNLATVNKGSGLINMENRAKLINATYSLISSTDKGVDLVISYPIVNQII